MFVAGPDTSFVLMLPNDTVRGPMWNVRNMPAPACPRPILIVRLIVVVRSFGSTTCRRTAAEPEPTVSVIVPPSVRPGAVHVNFLPVPVVGLPALAFQE